MATFKRYTINGDRYYLAEHGDKVVLINSESYHKPFDEFLNKRFVYYVYQKMEGWSIRNYIDSYDYLTYEILPTLRECKEKSTRIYFNNHR